MLAQEVQKLIPGTEITYDPCSVRSSIASQWPSSLDDSLAQSEWGWNYNVSMYDLSKKILDNIEP